MYTVIALTTKGNRVWLQGLGAHGWVGGTQYTTTYTPSLIIYTRATRDTQGKLRKVTAAKGGIIDTVGKKVTQWAQDSTQAHVSITHDTIIIERV